MNENALAELANYADAKPSTLHQTPASAFLHFCALTVTSGVLYLLITQ